VLREPEVAALADLDKQSLIARLTPYLLGIFPRSAPADVFLEPALVNSERQPWLRNPFIPNALPIYDHKPDLFISSLAFVEQREPGVEQRRGPGFVFGPVADAHLQLFDHVVQKVFEGKPGEGALTDTHFGELVRYCEYLGGRVVGLLFNARHFMLYRADGAIPLCVVRGSWTTRGAKKAVADFFADPADEPAMLTLLRGSLARGGFKLHPAVLLRSHRDKHVTRTCFLGAGAFGRVFCVAPAAAAPAGAASAGAASAEGTSVGGRGAGGGDAAVEPLALKAIMSTPRRAATLAKQEFLRLQQAAAVGAPVVKPVDGSLLELVQGVSFVLQDVGMPAVIKTADACFAAFQVLQQLHQKGFVHGDARLANLVVVPRASDAVALPSAKHQLLWVDLASTTCDVHFSAHSDVKQLTASLLKCHVDALPRAVMAAISSYSPDLSVPALRDIVDAVFISMR